MLYRIQLIATLAFRDSLDRLRSNIQDVNMHVARGAGIGPLTCFPNDG
jgi:hypothetical protein